MQSYHSIKGKHENEGTGGIYYTKHLGLLPDHKPTQHLGHTRQKVVNQF